MKLTSKQRIQLNLPRTPHRKKIEFSKILAIIVLLTGIVNILLYHIEIFYAINKEASVIPDASIVTQSIVTILGGFLSYCLYQFGLKNSRNKYGIDADGQPFEQPPSEDSSSTGTYS